MIKYIKLYYKLLIIFFFKIVNKKIEILTDKDFSTYKNEIKLIKNKKFNIFFIKKGKIFTNSVDCAAYIFRNKIIPEVSYQYKNSLQTDIKKNEVIKNGTPKFLKKIKKNIISLISGGAAKHNYGHWLFDVLSKYCFIKKNYKFNKSDLFYVPAYRYQFQKDSLKYLNINPNQVISSEKIRYIQGKNIISSTHTFSHNFSKINEQVIKEIKKTFLPFKNYSKVNTFDKIFIDRKYDKFNFLEKDLRKYKDERILINHKEIFSYLKTKNFHIIKCADLSFSDQIKIFSKAKIIVSLFGAELSNLVFCKPNTNVIEIKNNNNNSDFSNLSKKCNLNHQQIKLKPLFATKFRQNGILLCPISKLDIVLKNLKI